MDFIQQHLTEILSILGVILASGIGITIYQSRNNNSKKVVQKGIQAGGDVAGGDIDKSVKK
ncbi:hypothetical protein [Acinetobacter tibetensis]|uniref:Uncharacterized protein n=1 Tax=Acinetobacter tibetensis TaxID=2943497 RepID=A0AAE9S1I8_9GAMM|nr:hypothetical protein [Acinetobacter tibetensis]USE84319.1 hypothetical protein M5E07_05835 [Acinetobacter tibetensis]